MKIAQLTHYDTDGIVCAIVIKNCLPPNHDLDLQATGYGKPLAEKLKNILWRGRHDELVLFVTDLRLEKQELEAILKDSCVARLIYIDPHPREDHNDLEELHAEYKERFIYRWASDRCGSMLTYEYFLDGGFELDNVKEMVFLTDVYDMWRTNAPSFSDAWDLNALFWHFKTDMFISKFISGSLDYDRETKALLSNFRAAKKQYQDSAERVDVPLDPYKLLFVYDARGEWGNDWTVDFPDYDIYLMLKEKTSNTLNFSVRLNNGMKMSDISERVNAILPGVTGGGHDQAGGFVLEPTVDIEDFFNAFCKSILDIHHQSGL